MNRRFRVLREIQSENPFKIHQRRKYKKSKLILVSAINPTPAGEGKTTVSVGLCDGLNKIGKKTIAVLREPSLSPVFRDKRWSNRWWLRTSYSYGRY